MRRIFVSISLLGIAILFQTCLYGDGTCINFRLMTQYNAADPLNGDLIFTYNADRSLQQVSGSNNVENNFFYDRSGHLIRIEQNNGTMPKTVLLFGLDAKRRVISRYKDDNSPGDSLVFEYDNTDRIIKAVYYGTKTEISYYYDIEYPDASTVKKTVYLRAQSTEVLAFSLIHIYKLDDYLRPHPQEYYFSQDSVEQVFLPHNVLSKYTTSANGVIVGPETTHTYIMNASGYPYSQDRSIYYGYDCDEVF